MILLDAKIPAFGYSTYIINERPLAKGTIAAPIGVNADRICNISDDNLVLENDKLRAEFDAATMEIVSLIDKASGKEMVSPAAPAGVIRYIHENPRFGMTSWRVGPYMKVENLNETENVRVSEYKKGALRSYIKYGIEFKRSAVNVTVSLDAKSDTLTYDIVADWHEISKNNEPIPQLNFFFPVNYEVKGYNYDVAYGTIVRKEMAHDVPGNSFIQMMNEDGKAVSLITDNKYGFRGYKNSGAVSLIRSSRNPDPYPEYGIHNMKIGVAVTENSEIKEKATKFCHPISFCAGKKHSGSLSLCGNLMKIDGDVIVGAVKNAEDGEGIVIRLSEYNGNNATATLAFAKAIKSASLVDNNEKTTGKTCKVDGNKLTVDIAAYSTEAVLVTF